MKLKAFRIQNFRSIIDTGFQDLSPDDITSIIGQNESGKTSILDALNAFDTHDVSIDDTRIEGTSPTVTCIFKLDDIKELESITKPMESLPIELGETLLELDLCISFEKTWNIDDIDAGPTFSIENTALNNLFNSNDGDLFLEAVFENTPYLFAFEDTGLLPSTIDLDVLEAKNRTVEGYKGATNFLELADLSLEELKAHQANERQITNKIDKANAKLSKELQTFWSQTLGNDDKISIQMDIKNYDATTPGKQGRPYLSFWIKDKNGRLRPKQRSKGVKWFISFFMTLLATSLNNKNRVLLIDEPGANLHAKAQKDILDVLESVKENMQIIYATHSPYLLDIEKIYRVLAVERVEEEDSTVTKVYKFQDLGSASIDTLFPLYSNMGIDISHQEVIQQKHNVILEEISAFFYFKAFWILLNKRKSVYFLPATGVNNVPQLSNLMLGWGLDFSVVVDDDSAGRRIFKQLKDTQVLEEDKLIKIKDCDGVEDLFTQEDFKEHILKTADAEYEPDETNSSFLKRDSHYSKPLLGRNFLVAVESKQLTKSNLSEESIEKISSLIQKISDSL